MKKKRLLGQLILLGTFVLAGLFAFVPNTASAQTGIIKGSHQLSWNNSGRNDVEISWDSSKQGLPLKIIVYLIIVYLV